MSQHAQLPVDWHHEHVRECTSTQDLARAWAAGAPPRSVGVFSTDHQTAGRGREQRTWVDGGEGDELLASIAVRGPLPASVLHELSVRCAQALVAALANHDAAGAGLRVKAPNDVMVDDRKLAGVLVDASTVGDEVQWVVVGTGINVAGTHDEIAGTAATSIEQAWGLRPDRSVLLGGVATHVVAAIRADGGGGAVSGS